MTFLIYFCDVSLAEKKLAPHQNGRFDAHRAPKSRHIHRFNSDDVYLHCDGSIVKLCATVYPPGLSGMML